MLLGFQLDGLFDVVVDGVFLLRALGLHHVFEIPRGLEMVRALQDFRVGTAEDVEEAALHQRTGRRNRRVAHPSDEPGGRKGFAAASVVQAAEPEAVETGSTKMSHTLVGLISCLLSTRREVNLSNHRPHTCYLAAVTPG